MANVRGMFAWRVVRHGTPPEALSLDEVDRPEPGPGQLRVHVRTTVCNQNEVDGCEGRYRTVDPPLPYVLGMEVVGIVDATGPGLDGWLGRRVMACAVGAHGGHGQWAIVDPDMTFDVPDRLDDVEAAAVFFPFHLAWLTLFHRGGLRSGERLLVHSAAGGVGSAAVQLGVDAGATVIAVAGGAEKVARCRALGAHVAVDHTSEDWVAAALAATDGLGVDVAADLVGGTTTAETMRVMAESGRLVLVGFSGGIEAEDEGGLVPRPILFGNFSVGGIMLSYRTDPLVVRRAAGINCLPRSLGDRVHAELTTMLTAGRFRPVVGRVAPWTELPACLEDQRLRRTTGRTVIDWR
jgi:NADPH2:quinone reductase